MKNRSSSPPDSAGETPARSPLDWPAEAGIGHDLAAEIRAEVSRRRRVRVGVVATMCAVLLGVLLWQRPAGTPSALTSVAALSKVSVPERRTLPDGSVVELKNGAALEVDFTPSLRRVVLAKGTALFEVAKNPTRPFVVIAGGVEVRAVGTAFAVERGGAVVNVVVTEGRVSVARETAPVASASSPLTPRLDSALLAAGYGATMAVGTEAAPQVTVLSAAEIGRQLAWRVPLLEFSGAPLSEVVRLFAAHGSARFVVGDPELREVRVSGILRADNTEALLQLLAADHAIEAENRSGEIVLRRRR